MLVTTQIKSNKLMKPITLAILLALTCLQQAYADEAAPEVEKEYTFLDSIQEGKPMVIF